MITVLKTCTFLFLTLALVFSLKKIYYSKATLIHFVYCIFFVFYGLPIIMDVLFGVPRNDFFVGYSLVQQDLLTNVVYCVQLILVVIIWFTRVGKTNTSFNPKDITVKPNQIKVLYLLVLSPLVFVLFAPYPAMYLKYGVIITQVFDSRISSYHNFLSILTIVSVISAAVLLLLRKNLSFKYLVLISFYIIPSLWINGKRYILAQTIVLFIIVLYQKGFLTKKRMIIVFLVTITVMFSFSFIYQINFNRTNNSIQDLYANYRIDYARDNSLKLTLYHELHSEEKVLEYRFQSILFNLTLFIPREFWSGKPYPYAVYMTAKALGLQYIEYLGWGVTTGIIDEIISNIGLLGMLIAPFIIKLLCNFGDRQGPIIKLLTFFVVTLLLIVELSSFGFIFYGWLLMLVINKLYRRMFYYQEVNRWKEL